MSSVFRYSAFVSYSHMDGAWTSWLLRALETYRIPSHLVGRPGRNGTIPRRLGRIFRDREELAAGGYLDDKIIEALDDSGALIVVCSPNAARSKGVNREIEYFRETRGDEHIFYIIKSGTPNAVAAGEPEAQECFPPALLGRSPSAKTLMGLPLAADARPERDGRKGALLKIIAGIVGLPLDTLVRRELQRRNNRLLRATVAASMGGVFAIGLALQAYYATQQAEDAQLVAEERSEEAEDLIDFMLTELHYKMREAGQMPAMATVYNKVINYYNTKDPATVSIEGQGRRAYALGRIAQSLVDEGLIDEAVKIGTIAAVSSRELVQRDGENTTLIDQHAVNLLTLGGALWRAGQFDDCYEILLEKHTYAKRLSELGVETYSGKSRLANSNVHLGIFLLSYFANPSAAMPYFQEGLRLRLGLYGQDYPDMGISEQGITNVADGYYHLSLAQEYLGQLREAEENRRKAVAIHRKRIAENPDLVQGRHLLARTFRQTATILQTVGKTDEALAILRKASDAYGKLMEEGHDHGNWIEEWGYVEATYAAYCLTIGACQDARPTAEQAVKRLETLVMTTDASAGKRIRLLFAKTTLARILMTERQHKEAAALLAETKAELDTIDPSFLRSNDGRLLTTQFHMMEADLADAQGDNAQAASALESLVAKYAAIQKNLHPMVREQLMHASTRLGDTATATTIQRDLEAMEYQYASRNRGKLLSGSGKTATTPTSAK